jgi:hypothetical protein
MMPAPQQTAQGQPAGEAAYYQLKSRQEELGNQLESVTDRRDELAQTLVSKPPGADRDGIEARIKTLDTRIQSLETDLATVGKDLAQAAPASLQQPPPRIIRQGYGEEDLWGAGFIGASIAVALCIPIFLRNFRRRRWVPPGASSQTPALANERADRMEAAIDSIAVEIERVSENQRFMTRLMTETQLADTLAAVRGSTEAARIAAEKASNA